MRISIALFALFAIAIPASASPIKPLSEVKRFAGETTGRHIVKFKDSASKATHLDNLNSIQITHDWSLINGFAGNFDAATLDALRQSPEVEYISEDGMMYTSTTQFVTKTNAPWGLSRISSTSSLAGQSDSALAFNYTYDASAGSGVDIYIVDTGVLTTHTTFNGRASWGATFGGYDDADGNGHGTHCAGTAAGALHGVAKAANIIAVKVLSDDGSGSVSDIVSGLNWVQNQASSSGRPSIVSMSLGGSTSQPLDDAVNSLATNGIHVAVAAGNSNTDAGSTSPARASGAITVGASTISDARASFSNYGRVVAIWAPGLNVISSWIGSDTATNSISGTSMATPHIAGLIAYLIGLQGDVTPSAMKAKLQNLALKSVLTGVPSGTVNYLAHNA